MRNVIFLAVSMISALVAQPLQAQPARATACEALAGRWTWFTGVTVTFREGGIVDGALVFGQCEGTDAARRRYVVRWQNGFVDTLTLSGDGNTLDGTNAQAIRVFAARMGTSSSTTSRTAKCEALAGRWNWFLGPPVVIREDGTLDNGLLSGRCELSNAGQRRYTLHWQNGAIDSVALSPDDTRLDGINNVRVPVSATRIAVTAEASVDKPPELVPIPERSSSVAIVIGISNYREAEIPRLPYARSDAEIMAKYFENTAGIRKENMRLLADDRGALSDITDTIENWLPRRTTENSTVFVYYAGHGALDPATGDTYLVPFQKVTVLAAAQGNQISSDLDSAKHGLFTYFLLSGIRGGASSGRDGWIDLKALYDFVREKVQSTAISELNRDQTPALLGATGVESRAQNLKLFRTRK
jgi:hypothetical protein